LNFNAQEASADNTMNNNTFPLWAILIMAGGALMVIAVIITLSILLVMRRSKAEDVLYKIGTLASSTRLPRKN